MYIYLRTCSNYYPIELATRPDPVLLVPYMSHIIM